MVANWVPLVSWFEALAAFGVTQGGPFSPLFRRKVLTGAIPPPRGMFFMAVAWPMLSYEACC